MHYLIRELEFSHYCANIELDSKPYSANKTNHSFCTARPISGRAIVNSKDNATIVEFDYSSSTIHAFGIFFAL